MSSTYSVSSGSVRDLDKDPSPAETTAATDMTISVDLGLSEDEDSRGRSKAEGSRLRHEMHLLKLHLSQRDLTIRNMQSERLAQTEKLQSQLGEAIRQRDILGARSQAQARVQKEEASRVTTRFKEELDKLRERQSQLESINSKLLESTTSVKEAIRTVDLTDEKKYMELLQQDPEAMSISEFATLRIYHAILPLRSEIDACNSARNGAKSELSSLRLHLRHAEDEAQSHRIALNEARQDLHLIAMERDGLKSEVQRNKVKVAEYDRVSAELARIQSENSQLASSQRSLEDRCDRLAKDVEIAVAAKTAVQEKLTLLERDKEYLSRHYETSSRQAEVAEDKLSHAMMVLERTQRAYDEINRRYMDARESFRTDYESRLTSELHKLRSTAERELERTVTSTTTLYEREKEASRNVADMLTRQRDEAIQAEREMASKYDSLLQQLQEQRVNLTSKVADLEADARLKAFELERAEAMAAQLQQRLDNATLDKEQLARKVELLREELTYVQAAHEKRVSSLTVSLSQASHRLESFERLEKELDDASTLAAQMPDDDEAQRVLYGYAGIVPSHLKRCLGQSLRLARKVAALERQAGELNGQVEKERAERMETERELGVVKRAVESAGGDHGGLLQAVIQCEEEVRRWKLKSEDAAREAGRKEDQVRALRKEVEQLRADLEKVLSHREELRLIRRVLTGQPDPQHKPDPSRPMPIIIPPPSHAAGDR